MTILGFRRHGTSEHSPTLLVDGRIWPLLAVLAALCLASCSVISPSSTQSASQPSRILIAVQPESATLTSGGSAQFSAIVQNTSNTSVTWTADAGSISSQGLFIAPKVKATTSIHLTATSNADPTKTAAAVATVDAPATTNRLSIITSNIPSATQGTAYNTSLAATGGEPPYQWRLTASSLPSGISFHTDGTISGTTHQSGAFGLTASVTDATGQNASHSYTWDVGPGSSQNGTFDGPAELPRVYVKSSMADTPAPGSTISVSASSDLQSALNSAQCGDTIALQAGATFSGNFTVPAKNCDDSHWIIIRTAAPDSALPPEGTRITPCYAGVASLPGRPAFSCPTPANVMARIVFEGIGSQPIILASGANHIRFLGLEITRTSPGNVVYDLVSVQSRGTMDHLVFDRVWMHGTAKDETTRGIALGGSTYVAVTDSYFSDFHCIATTGACGDSQAINGGLGDQPMGPYKIVNNFLEASGENLMFGGGEATQNPQDLEIRQNHLFKPLNWMAGHAGFVGGANGNSFVVKNHLELKNAVRVLFEANVLENNWGGFTQSGFAILLTPKNQNGNCPQCTVHDITIRYSTVSHVGGGIVVGNGESDSGALSQGAWNESIHDLVMDDVDDLAFNGGGYLLQEGNGNPNLAVHDVAINHVTALSGGRAMLVVGNAKTNPTMANFSWTNSIFSAGGGIISTGGGSANCASASNGAAGVLKSCFNPYAFDHNGLIAATGSWPKGNYAPPSVAAVEFANPAQGNYQLAPSSPYKGAGSDGKDLGADIATLTSMITGVE